MLNTFISGFCGVKHRRFLIQRCTKQDGAQVIKVTKTKFTNAAIIIGVLMLLVLPACAGQFTVSSIDPKVGYNNGTVAIINLAGTNFTVPLTVNLKNESFSQIIPTTGFGFVTSSQIQCTFNLAGRPAGLYNVTVVNGSDTLNNATLQNGFEIVNPPPGLSSINPHTGINDDPALSFVVTGTNLILSGATFNLTHSGTTIKATDLVELIPNTSVSGKFNLEAAQNGTWYVDWKNYDGNISNTLTFTITNPLPTIDLNGISPTGTTNIIANQPVTVTGTGYLSGATVAIVQGSKQVPINGPNIFILTPPNSISFFANFTGQPVGPYNVTVTNPDNQNVTRNNGLRVFYPASPVVENITPNTGINTSSITNVLIGGSGFQPGAIINLTKSGLPDINATSVVVNNQSYITCTLPITGAPIGSWNVKVTNNDTDSYTLPSGFTITAPLASITNLHNTTYLQSSITWAWTDPTSPDFDHVTVYLDGVFKENVTQGAQTYTASSLTPGTAYTIGTNTVGTLGQVNTTWVNLTNWTAPVVVVPPVANFTGIPRSGTTTSMSVQFNDTSTGTGITGYQWILSDSPGTLFITQNLTHSFSPGVYNVNHSATNSAGTIWKNETGYINVTAPVVPPVADFTGIPRSGTTTSLSVQFNDTSTGTGITGYQWILSDSPGTLFITQNLTHSFSPGVYNVSHSATNGAGTIWKNETGYINVTAPVVPPVVNFTASQTAGFVPLNVSFTDQSITAPFSNWLWTFGIPGPQDTRQNPSYQYEQTGNFTVNLTVTNASGTTTLTKLNYIIVTNKPVADFIATTPTYGNMPLPVNFADLSTGSPTGWYWQFGDGTNSTNKTPDHIYTTPGVYSPNLTVSNAGGSGVPYERPGYITVAPVASFTATPPTTGDVPLKVQFNDTSMGAPTAWAWDFGDHSPSSTSSEQNPSHIYVTPGVWTVRLEVTKAGVSNTSVRQDLINATQPKPVAGFTGGPPNGTKGVTEFHFIDQSTNNPTSWLWSFGDGTYNTSRNTTHIYQSSGNKYISLTASNAGGSDTAYGGGPIVVRNPQAVPNFTGTPTLGSIPLMVQFTDTSSNSPTTWVWDFGDGFYSRGNPNPVHTYNVAGTYNVTLQVNDTSIGIPALNPFKRTAYITAVKTPIAAFTANQTSGPIPLVVRFTDQSQGNPYRYSWNFGDRYGSTEKNPTHIYQRTGNYTVTETVRNPAGFNTIVKQNLIIVTKLPEASFTVNATSGIEPTTIRFTDTSTGVPNPNSWSWNFGDGAPWFNTTDQSKKNPVHTYLSSGVYSVQLIISNGIGSSSVTKPSLITIGSQTKAQFEFSPMEGDVPLMIQFTDTSYGNPISYAWNFGDGRTSVSNEKNPVHTYTRPDNYTVTLTIKTSNRGTDTTSQVLVLTGKPVASFKANPISGSSPLTVQFTDTSMNNPTFYSWTFGDGEGSFGNDVANPVHTYSSPGPFNAKLFVSNSYGSDTSPPTQITVSQFP